MNIYSILIGIFIGLILFSLETLAASGEGVPAATVFSQMTNFGLLMGLIFFTQRKKIGTMFKQKRAAWF